MRKPSMSTATKVGSSVASIRASFASASNYDRLTLYHTLFSRTTFASAVSGCIASMAAMTICYPLERVRTIAQLKTNRKSNTVVGILKELVETEGFEGLYFGLGPVLSALGASNFVYFYFYSLLKVVYQGIRKQQGEISGLANLFIASLAGSLNVLITTPLWVVVTRLAAQSKKRRVDRIKLKNETAALSITDSGMNLAYNGVLDGIVRIAKDEGISNLWSGTSASLILVSNPSVQFASYERLKQALLASKFGSLRNDSLENLEEIINNVDLKDIRGETSLEQPDLSSIEYLILGAVAKMIATLVTYPLQIAQAKMRADVGKENSDGKIRKTYTSTIDCLVKVFNVEGLAGWYKGMDAKLLQTCLTSAFMFAFYENIYATIFKLLVQRRLTATE
mmetsp:Transcript_4026/g.4529  ORF Transcript_4026/g.4529 Transcript_4026/m.4529 type:complete len:394 (-) Transcript_4026:375-1556(-)